MIDDDDETGNLPDIGSYLPSKPASGSTPSTAAAGAGANDDNIPPMRDVTVDCITVCQSHC